MQSKSVIKLNFGNSLSNKTLGKPIRFKVEDLLKTTNANMLLCGASGAGKTTSIIHKIYQIANSEQSNNHRILLLTPRERLYEYGCVYEYINKIYTTDELLADYGKNGFDIINILNINYLENKTTWIFIDIQYLNSSTLLCDIVKNILVKARTHRAITCVTALSILDIPSEILENCNICEIYLAPYNELYTLNEYYATLLDLDINKLNKYNKYNYERYSKILSICGHKIPVLEVLPNELHTRICEEKDRELKRLQEKFNKRNNTNHIHGNNV